MRKLFLAAAAALLFVCPARAQSVTSTVGCNVNGVATYCVSGTLTTLTTDYVPLGAPGSQWSTVRFTVVSAGSATATAQVSTDGAINWNPSAYAKRLSTTSANPTEQAISATTLTTGDVWEIPLPANSTHFRLLCGGTGTTTTVTLSGAIPYVPGSPVVAVLYDVTSGTNTANNTPTIDATGWTSILHDFTMNGGTPTFAIAEVDDTGTPLANLVTGSTAFSGGIGLGAVIGGTAGLVAATAQIPLPRRLSYASGAIVSQTSRVRIVAHR